MADRDVNLAPDLRTSDGSLFIFEPTVIRVHGDDGYDVLVPHEDLRATLDELRLDPDFVDILAFVCSVTPALAHLFFFESVPYEST